MANRKASRRPAETVSDFKGRLAGMLRHPSGCTCDDCKRPPIVRKPGDPGYGYPPTRHHDCIKDESQ